MRKRQGAAVVIAAVAGLMVVAPLARAQTAPASQPPASQLKKPAAPRTAAAQNLPVPPAPVGVEAVVTKPGQTAFDASQRALVDRVSTYLSGLQTLIGDFVQVGPDRTRSEGRFYLQKPGRVRFEYNPPSPVELVADGQSVAVRDRRLATQDILPLSQTPLRFLLAERIDLLRDTNVIAVRTDDTFVTVVIEERQTLGGSHRLMLMFGGKDLQLKQWTITDPQGYDTTVAVYNLDTTKKPDPAMFKINYERMLQ